MFHFSDRQESRHVVPCIVITKWVQMTPDSEEGPSPGDLPDPGIEPRSPELQVDSLLSEPPGKPSVYI